MSPSPAIWTCSPAPFASVNGGNISITAGGNINAGSDVFTVTSDLVRGIFTTVQSDISVIATGDINVNGSRIATFDGGDITVESLAGNINAGKGASSTVTVDAYYVDPLADPLTRQVYHSAPELPFSGIVALTFPERNSSYPAPVARLGNILVEAPQGDVVANFAGILQIPLNYGNYPNASVTVLAGYEMNNQGEPVFSLGDKNVATLALGSTFELSNLGVPVLDADGHPIVLTQLLDAGGTPVLDAAGNQLYVEQLYSKPVVSGGPVIICSLDGNKLSINKYLDSAGYPVNVVTLPGTSDSQGNAMLVYGRYIDASGSGVLASNAKLEASGNIIGLIFAFNNIDIIAQQNVNVTALGGQNVNVSSSAGTITGTLIGGAGVNASGSSVDASLISANVSGATSGQSGLGQGTAANGTAQAASSDDSAKTAVAATQTEDDDTKKKKDREAVLVQKTGRVTVLLPPKNLSQNQTSSNHL